MNGKEKRRPVIGIVPSMRDGKIRMSAAYSEAVFRRWCDPCFHPLHAGCRNARRICRA
ncbi:MAG: hypothetical protein V8T53_00610 [Eubacteriales bacterium]